eukprot:TRINITY_DN5731_c0_g1_i3.p1 TRINITY_DN5731_c0_g1~~TRINITY_DN5731_c0_g1_i3.p1  ORF type:complete len:388 (+),score=68.94 TRINITY_DN5731_c0_g1_i3:27-1190(+)
MTLSFANPFLTVNHCKPIQHPTRRNNTKGVSALLELEDGTILSAISGDSIKQWKRSSQSPSTMTCIKTLPIPKDVCVSSLQQVSHNVVAIFGKRNDNLRFWNINSSVLPNCTDQYGLSICTVALKKQTMMKNTVACGVWKEIILFRVEGDDATGSVSVTKMFSIKLTTMGYIATVQEQRDEVLVICSSQGVVQWWHLTTQQCLCTTQRISEFGLKLFPICDNTVLTSKGYSSADIGHLQLKQKEVDEGGGGGEDIEWKAVYNTIPTPELQFGDEIQCLLRDGGWLVISVYSFCSLKGTDKSFRHTTFKCCTTRCGKVLTATELSDGAILAGTDAGSIALWLVKPPNSLVGRCCIMLAQLLPVNSIKQLPIPDELKDICSSYRHSLFA